MTPIQNPNSMNNDSFKILGVISVPAKHVSTTLSVLAIGTVLYLADLFFDYNPIKTQVKKLFPAADPEVLPS